jgi:hypothetical protein
MSGKVSWLLEIDGLPAAISSVKSLRQEVERLMASMKGVSFGGGSQSSDPFATMVKSLKGAKGEMKKVVEQADKLSASFGANKNKDVLRDALASKSPAFWALNPHLAAQLGEKSGVATGTKFAEGLKHSIRKRLANVDLLSPKTLQTAINESLGIGAGQNRPNRKSYTAFWENMQSSSRSGAMADFARRGSSQEMINLQAAIAQGDYNINNPKKSGGGGRVGRLIGFFGGEEGGKLSQIFGALGAFRIALWELQPVINAVKFAFNQMAEAVQRGSKLFLDSAKLGTSQFRLARARNVGALLGIDEGEVDRMMEQGQFGTGRRGGSVGKAGTSYRRGGAISVMGEIFGARSPDQMAQLQQLTNLQKYLAGAESDTAQATRTSTDSAKALYYVMYDWKSVMIELKSAMEGITALLSPFLRLEAIHFKLLAQGLNEVVDALVKAGRFLHLIPQGEDFAKSFGGSSRIPVSQYERIGFHFGRGTVSGTDDVGRNTSQMVGLLKTIAQNTTQLSASTTQSGGMAGGWTDMNSLKAWQAANPATHNAP